MSEKKINVKLLRRVKALILEEPRRFNMDYYAATEKFYPDLVHDQAPPCGTVACIAGWATLEDERARGRKRLTPAFLNRVGRYTGARALGLTFEQSQRLFYTEEWPDEFAEAYNDAMAGDDFAMAADIAATRIDHFIKTKGAE